MLTSLIAASPGTALGYEHIRASEAAGDREDDRRRRESVLGRAAGFIAMLVRGGSRCQSWCQLPRLVGVGWLE